MNVIPTLSGGEIELAQKRHMTEIRQRLTRGDKPAAIPQTTADAIIIGGLREEVAALQKALARAQASLRFVADREQHHGHGTED